MKILPHRVGSFLACLSKTESHVSVFSSPSIGLLSVLMPIAQCLDWQSTTRGLSFCFSFSMILDNVDSLHFHIGSKISLPKKAFIGLLSKLHWVYDQFQENYYFSHNNLPMQEFGISLFSSILICPVEYLYAFSKCIVF